MVTETASPKRAKTPPFSKPLSRAKIAAAAIEIIREEGSAALSMRKVAGLFGVDVAALYRHFRNKDELLAEVGERASVAAALELPADGTWEERFFELCRGIRDRIVRYPELGLHGGGSPGATPFLAKANGLIASLLCEAGLQGEKLTFGTLTVLHLVTSAAQSEALNRAGQNEDHRAFARTIQQHLSAEVLEAWAKPAPGTNNGLNFDDFFEFVVRAALKAALPEAGRNGS